MSSGWPPRRPGQCGYGAVGAVVGATYPAQLAELRAAMPHTWFLVPGFGAQGGTAADVAGAFDAKAAGRSSTTPAASSSPTSCAPMRSASVPARWQEAVEAATRDMIEQLRAETPAGKLPGA